MDLKALLGDQYKDDMTLSEVEQALGQVELVDPKTLPKSVSKDTFDKTASELAKYKKELQDLKASQLSADEKVELELQKAKELQTQYARELSSLRAKEIFVQAGLKESEYEGLLESVVTDDNELTGKRAQAFVDLLTAQKTQVEKDVRLKVLDDTPRPPASGGTGGLDQQIAAAQRDGDMSLMAALLRQQQQT